MQNCKLSLSGCSFVYSIRFIRMNASIEHQERFYRDWDIGPIVALFIAGLIFLGIYLACEYCCCCSDSTNQNQTTDCDTCVCPTCQGLKCNAKNCSCANCHSRECDCECRCHKLVLWLVGELIKLVYGDEFYLVSVHQHANEVNEETGRIRLYIGRKLIHTRAKCLNVMLGLTSILLMTFLAIVFADNYFVTTIPGCQEGLPCYPEDDDYNQYPIKNCSEYLEANNLNTLCYRFPLSAQPALSAVGGIFITSKVLIIMFARLMIWFTSKCLKRGVCFIRIIQLIVTLVFVVAAVGLTVLTSLESDEKPTKFRLAGYIIQYLTVGFTVLFAIVSPWYQLLKCNCVDQNFERNVDTSPTNLVPSTDTYQQYDQ